jgi:hypothetical protein
MKMASLCPEEGIPYEEDEEEDEESPDDVIDDSPGLTGLTLAAHCIALFFLS